MRKHNLPQIGFVFCCMLFFLSINPANARTVHFVKEYNYQASEIDSKVTCRVIALEQVKRLLLEELGTYLESKTEVRNFQLTQDQITTLTAGIVSAVVINEKWDGVSYYLKAKISADPDEVARSIEKLRNDRQKSKDLDESKKMAHAYADEIKRIKKELEDARIENKNLQVTASVVKKYNAAVDGLSARDLFDKAIQIGFDEKKYEEGVELLSKAILKDPNYYEAYLHRCFLYWNLSDDRCGEDCEKAYDLNPDYPNPEAYERILMAMKKRKVDHRKLTNIIVKGASLGNEFCINKLAQGKKAARAGDREIQSLLNEVGISW